MQIIIYGIEKFKDYFNPLTTERWIFIRVISAIVVRVAQIFRSDTTSISWAAGLTSRAFDGDH